jgi:cobaltochelatase CobT
MSGKQDLTRQEEFKRATAGVLRAMAHADAEVQVAFQPGPSGVAGKRVRLPLPTRALPANEMAKLRGAADAAALKLRHHDEALHASRIPTRREAKEVFDALEQVRVEAVGSQHMAGVAANLRAKLIEECEAEGYDRMTRKDQMPLPAALGLIARERLTGEAAPEAAHRVLDLWRDTIGEDAEQALAEMATTAEDQGAFARAARKLLTALDLAEAEMEAESRTKKAKKAARARPSRTNPAKGRANPNRKMKCSAPSPSRCKAKLRTKKPRNPKKKAPRPMAMISLVARSSAAKCRRWMTPRATTPSPRNSMKWWPPMISATPKNSPGFANS